MVVIDNTFGDEAAQRIATDRGARYLIEPLVGLSRARNRALFECATDIIAFLDDDAVPDQKWLQHLIEPFADRKVAAVTGRIKTPDSTSNGASAQPRVVNSQVPQWFEIVTFGGLGLGGNMALRRSACNGKKVFDERLGRGAPFQIGEESFAFAWILSRGFTAVYTPQAVVSHPPMSRASVGEEARNSIAYWLLLCSEFPRHRLDLIRFLVRRLRRKPLRWPRDPQEPGEIITANISLKLRAAFSGALLYWRTPKPRSR